MFDALEVSLQFLDQLVPLEERIRRKSPRLGKQLGDAAESISLNLGEGRRRRGGDARHHYEMAAGSASEVTTALRMAVLRRFITADELAAVDVLLDRVRAMLWRLAH